MYEGLSIYGLQDQNRMPKHDIGFTEEEIEGQSMTSLAEKVAISENTNDAFLDWAEYIAAEGTRDEMENLFIGFTWGLPKTPDTGKNREYRERLFKIMNRLLPHPEISRGQVFNHNECYKYISDYIDFCTRYLYGDNTTQAQKLFKALLDGNIFLTLISMEQQKKSRETDHFDYVMSREEQWTVRHWAELHAKLSFSPHEAIRQAYFQRAGTLRRAFTSWSEPVNPDVNDISCLDSQLRCALQHCNF